MDPRIASFVILGLGLMFAVGIEKALSRSNILSLPIVYVAAGWALFSLPFNLPNINPLIDSTDIYALEYITEFIVIVSLMGAGIAIDRPLNWPNWKQIWPLLGVTMPITILLVALYGWWALSLAPASAILLGGVLAPTDPVLARSVQVGPPGKDKRHDLRFNLTVEAGLNDGLAFPFIHLAIAAIGMTALGSWTLLWLAEDVFWRIGAGTLVGYLVGWAAGWFVFQRYAGSDAPDVEKSMEEYSTSEGPIVFGALLLAYGLAELCHGYGFLAVFVAAVIVRQREARSSYHRVLHHFIEQIEKVILVAMLLAFGGMLASGVMDELTWAQAGLGLLLIFVIRPLGGLIGEFKSPLPRRGKAAMAFLGVRGLGSIYYLAYAQNHGDFPGMMTLWGTVSFAILASIVIHGTTTMRLMKYVEDAGAHVYRKDDDEAAADNRSAAAAHKAAARKKSPEEQMEGDISEG